MEMKNAILAAVEDAIRAVETLKQQESVAFIESIAKEIVCCFRKKHKLPIAGNGGSLCDAMHFAEELTGQFRNSRAALPAIALSDPGFMSCVANDMGFDQVFARGVEALGQPGDLF